MKIKLSLLVLLFVSGLQGSLYQQTKQKSTLELATMLIKKTYFIINGTSKYGKYQFPVQQGSTASDILNDFYSDVLSAVKKFPIMERPPSILYFHNAPPANDDKPLSKITMCHKRGIREYSFSVEEVSYDSNQCYNLAIVNLAELKTVENNIDSLKKLRESELPVVFVTPDNLTASESQKITTRLTELGFFSAEKSETQEQESECFFENEKSKSISDSIKENKYSILATFGAAALLYFLYCKFAR